MAQQKAKSKSEVTQYNPIILLLVMCHIDVDETSQGGPKMKTRWD